MKQTLLCCQNEPSENAIDCITKTTTRKPKTNKRLPGLAIAFLILLQTFCGSTYAQTLLPIPAHSSIYSGLVRGYWFTAPTNFTITGLKVCVEAGTGLQYIHVFKINDPTPVLYPTTSSNFTTLAYIQGATNNVIQTVSIAVASGDKIGIIGAVGATTDNSYSAAVTPYSSTINGFTATLGRIGYQGAITTSAAPNYFTEATGSISRVEMWYTVVSPCTGSPNTPTITTAAMVTPICLNGTKAIAAADPSPPTGIQYQWEQSSSSTGPWTNAVGGTGATTLSYTTAALTTTTWFRIKAICGTNTAPSAAYQVVVGGVPAQPGTITGNTAVCSGTQTYSVVAVTGATSYTWSLPAGWSGSSTTNTISATPGSTGSIAVTANNACGSSTAQSLSITVGGIPSQPGTIVGPSAPCPAASLTYSVPVVSGATTYNWTLPSGWTGSSATNVINVVSGAGSGNFSVTATNGCGTSAATSLFVAPTTAVPTPGNITGSTSVCVGSTQTYSVPAVSGLSYNWTAPAGWLGIGTGNSINFQVGTGSGPVSVTASGSCGTSSPTTLTVTSSPIVTPLISISTSSSTICASSLATFTASAAGGGTAPVYQWKKNGANVGTNSLTYTDAGLNNGDIISVVLTTNAACATASAANSNTVTMNVNPIVVPGININILPGAVSCANTSLTFVSNITGGGTNPIYQWYRNGNIIAGASAPTYTTSGLANNDTITAAMLSNAACLTASSVSSNKFGVVINPLVVPSITVMADKPMPLTLGTSVTFTASFANAGSSPSLQWMKNSDVIPFQTNATFTTSSFGAGDRISVRLVSSAPCASPGIVVSVPMTLTVQNPEGIGNAAGNWSGSLNLHPNPNTGHFTIDAVWAATHNGERVRIDLINNVGQSVYNTELVPGRAQWSHNVWLPDGVANGLYQLRIHTPSMQAIKPVMIQR